MEAAARGAARLNVSAFIAHFFTTVEITENHFAWGINVFGRFYAPPIFSFTNARAKIHD
jgi:hypothetical protein